MLFYAMFPVLSVISIVKVSIVIVSIVAVSLRT